jgi:hypothetical protein
MPCLPHLDRSDKRLVPFDTSPQHCFLGEVAMFFPKVSLATVKLTFFPRRAAPDLQPDPAYTDNQLLRRANTISGLPTRTASMRHSAFQRHNASWTSFGGLMKASATQYTLEDDAEFDCKTPSNWYTRLPRNARRRSKT